MSKKSLISFSKFSALDSNLEVVAHLGYTTNEEVYAIEEVRVPRMLDVMGNKYYLTNVNKYLEPENSIKTLISVFVTNNEVIETTLIEWLNTCKIEWTREVDTR